MASYRGHTLGALCAWVCLLMLFRHCTTITPHCVAEWMFCTLIGGFLPDVDVTSKGQKFIYGLLFVCMLLNIFLENYYGASWLGLVMTVPLLCNHRGIFHDPFVLFGIVMVFATSLLVKFPLATRRIVFDTIFVGMGIVTHLALDGRLRLFRYKKF